MKSVAIKLELIVDTCVVFVIIGDYKRISCL